MSARTIKIEIKINYPVILVIILILHVIGLTIRGLMSGGGTSDIMKAFQPNEAQTGQPLQIRSLTQEDLKRIRTVGAKDSKIKDGVYLQKNPSTTRHVTKDLFSPNPYEGQSRKETAPHKSLSLADLAMGKQQPTPPKQAATPPTPPKPVRPGTRPEIALPEKTKAINAISLKGEEIKQFMRDSNSTGGPTVAAGDAASLSGDPRAQSLSNSDVMVNLEVPEGVDPDELNKYELMFYGFQRRTAIGYVNSFYKHLDKFMAENPHLQFPMTETKQVMTGRLTYDSSGNIKQIKMVRWSNIERLQDFFVNVLKDMDTLHNPPQALWDKTGEFSIFFSLVING